MRRPVGCTCYARTGVSGYALRNLRLGVAACVERYWTMAIRTSNEDITKSLPCTEYNASTHNKGLYLRAIVQDARKVILESTDISDIAVVNFAHDVDTRGVVEA